MAQELVGYRLQEKRGEQFVDVGIICRTLEQAEAEKAKSERAFPHKEYAVRPTYSGK